MLRKQFGEPRRVDSGLFLEACEAIHGFTALLDKVERSGSNRVRLDRLERLAAGFLDALNELEQSQYCAIRYKEKLKSSCVEDMGPEERDDYRLHVYYYKNAFIRVFSCLDKLGHFMNELLELRTERVKRRYSFYTVLRQLEYRRVFPELQKELFGLKVKYAAPMLTLRKKRNMEIHQVNSEMLDDMVCGKSVHFAGSVMEEELTDNLADLDKGFRMVCESMRAVFTFTLRILNP